MSERELWFAVRRAENRSSVCASGWSSPFGLQTLTCQDDPDVLWWPQDAMRLGSSKPSWLFYKQKRRKEQNGHPGLLQVATGVSHTGAHLIPLGRRLTSMPGQWERGAERWGEPVQDLAAKEMTKKFILHGKEFCIQKKFLYSKERNRESGRPDIYPGGYY